MADLDYGGTFLWTLNTEWLDAWNAKGLSRPDPNKKWPPVPKI